MGLFNKFGLNSIIHNEYLRALVVFFLLVFVFRVILGLLGKIFLKLSNKTNTDLDDLILKKSSKPINILSFLASLVIAINEITFSNVLEEIINKLIYSGIVITIGYIIFILADIGIIRIWKKFAEKTQTDLDDSLISLAHSALKASFVVIVLLYVLNLWGIEVGPFLAGLGIAGLAVALALQPTLSNIFSGISLVIDQTFKVGDVIKLESGELGTVHKIGLRTTRINTFDNEMIIVPNSNLANTRVQNFFQPDKSIRVNVDFGVEYGVDPEYIKKIVIEEIEKIKIADKTQEARILFLNMADSSLNFKAMFWVDDISKKWPAHQEAITRIYRRLYKENIGIPFPQRTIWLRDEGKAQGINPSDNKYKEVQGKYLSNFGHEYKEEKTKFDKTEERRPKKRFSLNKLKEKISKKFKGH